MGFLEHVVDIGRFPRELMQHLHHPMRAGGECDRDPLGTLEPDGRRDGYLRKWRSILLNTPGSSLLAACEQRPLDTKGHTVWHLRSDAMLETYGAAMGGCLYGAWWHFPLVRKALTIPALEMLAACVNFVVFADQLQHAKQVLMEIDALASPIALYKDKAKSPGLRAILAEFRRLPQLRRFTDSNALFCQHCYGEGNPLADAASRLKLDVLNELGGALGMQMRRVSMGAEALAFINRVLQRLDATPLTVDEIEFDSTLGYPGEGPPSAATPPNRASTNAPASASPALLAFLRSSEATGAPRALSYAASPPPPPPMQSSSPSPTAVAKYSTAAAATPPLRLAAPSPPSGRPRSRRGTPPAEALPASAPDPTVAPRPLHAIAATVDAWCPSLLADSSDALAAEEIHRAFAASQCAHIAAERAVPSLLVRLANPCAPPSPPSASRAHRATQRRAAASSSSSTLSLAAAARARALATALLSDSESGGIILAEGEADALSLRMVQLLESAAASNTLQGEKSNWKHWVAFCTHRNVDPFRKDVRAMDHTAYDKEVVVLALALLFIYGRMGCRKGRTTPPRPASALAVLRGIRRAHARLGIQMADLSLATRLADALNKEYIDAHGWEALQVDRVAPLTNPIIAGMVAAKCIAGDSTGATAARALWATMAQTGFRKAEVATSKTDTFGPSSLTRHNLRWRISGVETADPSEQQLRGMREGDLAILIPPKSKCDQFGLEWGQAPIYLRFSSRARICAARALRDLELRLPRHGREQREDTALFTRNDGRPLTTADVDALFKQCLSQSGVQRAAVAKYSPHSFRRYLACALKAQGASDSTIQALLRWKTAESLKLYSILNDESYADLIDAAGKADVSSVRTNALPRAELLDVAASFDAAGKRLVAAAAAAQAAAPEDDVVDPISDDGDSSGDEDVSPPAPPPRPQPKSRKRASTATRPDAPRPPSDASPLTVDTADGRRAVVPANIYPSEHCRENSGAGWDVIIDEVDRRLNAALVRFVHARDAGGNEFTRVWLKLESLHTTG